VVPLLAAGDLPTTQRQPPAELLGPELVLALRYGTRG
jgi:hypothetical protein